MKRPYLIPMLIICTASVAHAQQSVRKTIEANNSKFIEAFNSGNAAAIGPMYASDARLLPPNSPAIEGRQNIQAFWQNFISMGVKLVKLDITHVETSGNIAVEVGRYALTIPGAGGATTTDEGKYVVVWKRQGRNWKLAVDIFNTSKSNP
jgi:uncharacterized protein (TIGR02246 family)